jgi:hypothetical protein
MTAAECPFLTLCERDFVGPALSTDEQEGLSDHLSTGCETCEGQIEVHLSGSGEGDLAEGVRELGDRLTQATDFAGDAMAGSQLLVLARVQARIGEEDVQGRRRIRRRQQRILFYVVNLVAVVLICSAYVGTLTAARVKNVAAKRTSTVNELNALAAALAAYLKLDGSDPPKDMPALLVALQTKRPGRETPFYPLDPKRLSGVVYTDEFVNPFRYRAEPGRALLYSVGPNGVDDLGERDDIVRRVQFLHR